MPPPGGVTVAAHRLLAGPRTSGSKAMWKRVKQNSPKTNPMSPRQQQQWWQHVPLSRRKGVVPSDAGVRVQPSGRPLEVIHSRNALSDAGSNVLHFSHSQPIIMTGYGREKFGADIWRRIIDDPGAFPPECWQLFLSSNLTALGGKGRPVCVGMTWSLPLAAGTMRQWRMRLEEVNRKARQFGAQVQGGDGVGSVTHPGPPRG